MGAWSTTVATVAGTAPRKESCPLRLVEPTAVLRADLIALDTLRHVPLLDPQLEPEKEEDDEGVPHPCLCSLAHP